MRRLHLIQCPQCGQEGPHQARGLCRMCYQYAFRTGRPRPRALDGGPQRCAACGGLLTSNSRHAFGCCHACYLAAWHFWQGITRQPRDWARVAIVARQRAARRAEA